MERTLLTIDPGCEQSAYLSCIRREEAVHFGQGAIIKNYILLDVLRSMDPPHIVCIEFVQSFGMPVGQEVFYTCYWAGRFAELMLQRNVPVQLIYRSQVKMHLCGSMRAKDRNIRQALIDRWGKPGTKKAPGTLYGIKSHLWSAVALVTYAIDKDL